MEIINVTQGSPEWFSARCGIPSASNFSKIITTAGKPSTQRKKYMYQLAGEKITGIKEETYQNATMARGIEMEQEARDFYNLINNVEVQEVGFCLADGYGCSPDAFVGRDGLLEIKCPLMATHVGYLLDNKLPSDYFQQIQGQLLVTGREWCDFVSYYPGLKPLIIRVERDEVFIQALRAELEKFISELKSIITTIK